MHESFSKYCGLPERVLNGTVSDLLKEFQDQEYISKSAAEAKQLEVQIICSEECLVCHCILDEMI